MSGASSTRSVVQVDSRHRFELVIDGRQVAIAAYQDVAGRRHFTHTETDPAYGGRGLATALVDQALATTRAAGLRIVPECSFVAHYLQQHPEYLDIVDLT